MARKFFASVVIDPIYENRKLIGYAKITRDITERQQALAELNESESQFKLLVGGVTDYALYMLSPEGIISNWNAGGQRIKGYTPQEIIGQSFARFYTPADQAAGKPARALKIAEETGHYEEDGWRVRKDGSFFWASVVIDPIRDDGGRLIGFAKITRDISERREAQQKLEQVQRQLAESQKMDALGQLTGGVAHDFNNLLMIISGNLHKIRKELNSEQGLRALSAIETASRRAASLTSQLLSFARRQSVNPQTIEVADRIIAVREVLSSALGSMVALHIDIPAEVWPVFVDPAEFETALLNLVINARDAMPEGGTLIVSARNDPEHQQVVIRIEDSGDGNSRRCARKGLRPVLHHQAGRQRHRAWSCRRSTASPIRPAAAIEIESEVGKGTTVSIRLPRAVETAKVEVQTSSKNGAGTVLLVEDNPDVADASAGLLEQLGYTVRWVSDAETALQELEANGIDLVFSDIVMPGKMDGLRLAQNHPGEKSGAADPPHHRLQRERQGRSGRFSRAPQAVPAARTQPRTLQADRAAPAIGGQDGMRHFSAR